MAAAALIAARLRASVDNEDADVVTAAALEEEDDDEFESAAGAAAALVGPAGGLPWLVVAGIAGEEELGLRESVCVYVIAGYQ